MNFVFFDTYFPDVIKYVYGQNKGLGNLSYRQQLQKILALKFGTADFYSRNLRKLGHKASDYVINAGDLQNRWAHEHPESFFQKFGSLFLGTKTTLERQLDLAKPGIIYCQNLSSPGPAFIKHHLSPGQLIVGQTAYPIDFNRDALSVYGLILTSFPHYVTRLRRLGLAAEYFRIGFEESLCRLLPKRGQKYPVAFVGNLTSHHQSGLPTFEYLATKVPFHLWGYGWEKLPADSPLWKHLHLEPAWGLDMYNIYRQTAIAVNRHIDVAENFANNMRLYETTGVGTMLITDYKDNLSELFKIGSEVETYRTKEELVDKVRYYLSHPRQREKIARAGQRRTLRDHTYRQRMFELLNILKKYL